MMSNLLSIGKSALTAAQAWVSVTGDNIANADTAGYTRRYVVQNEAPTVRTGAGEVGLGCNAEQVLRYFDKFLEDNYLDESTLQSRWTEYDNIMETLESIFNEANTTGLNDAMDKFFNAWQKLALDPDDPSVRTSVLNYGQTVDDMFATLTRSVRTIQDEMNISIENTVTRINEISESIAKINKQIATTMNSETYSPNSLYDQRDALVEELATLVDVKTIDSGKGNYRVQLSTGQPLVDAQTTYSVEFMTPAAENRLVPSSEYEGKVEFQGLDDFEYTIEIVSLGDDNGNAVSDPTTQTPPLFRVSLDGGTTWLVDDDGQELHFPLVDKDGDGKTDQVLVKELEISFTTTDEFHVGDRFDIVPKKGLYWIEPTRGPENITPQITLTGNDNTNRVTGGKLAAYFGIRDDCCGRYLDELDALAHAMIWEVNRLHTQGAGLEKLTNIQGEMKTLDADKPLGCALSGNQWYNKLQEGNVNLFLYDATTDTYLATSQLDMNGDGNYANFDPDTHSLNDVIAALESITVPGTNGDLNVFNVSLQDDKISIQVNGIHVTYDTDGNPVYSESGTDSSTNIAFAFGEDTSGLLAALGLNNFFAGTDASSIELGIDIAKDYTKISAGRVNGQYEVNVGDNTIATAIGALSTKDVTVNTFWRTVSQTLPEYYAGHVSTVGSDKLHAETNKAYHTALTDDLLVRKESVSGVNLDEEMTNLVKYQSAYKAAAKLITTADEMMGVLLGLKQ